MKTLFIIQLLILVASAHPDLRIIGGRDAQAGEFPYAAAITWQTSSGTYFCAGALISNQWIITSGSCVDGAILFSIRLGSESLSSNDNNVQRLTTDSYILHPNYNASTFENDIGLIKLRIAITFTDYIQPITLTPRDVQTYAVVSAIGWGQISDDDAGIVDKLQTVVVTTLSTEECQQVFGSQITENMVCIDGNYNQGTCRGDTGGPLVQYVNGHQARLVGVSSFISGNGCESTDPSGYARLFPYLDWVKNNTGIE